LFKRSDVASPQFSAWIVKHAKALAPVVRQLDAFTAAPQPRSCSVRRRIDL
jgi:hypothetical protein